MRVCIVHQHDPTANYPAGIGTFINTFVKYAPGDFEFALIGVSADPSQYRIGRWHRVALGKRGVNFLPIVSAHPNRRTRMPLSLRFAWALARARHAIDDREAILTFHRIEPCLALKGLETRKVLFLHAHSQDFYNPKTDSMWGKIPWLYFRLEQRLIEAMQRIWIVREDAVDFYRLRYPALADRIAFLPTWADEEVFISLSEADRLRQKQRLASIHGFDPTNRLLLFVGRFESPKDPLFLLEAFRYLNGFQAETRLVMIGEGSLEPSIRRFLALHDLTPMVRLVSPQSQIALARWMNIADCLVLSSAYEGMPLVVLEALRCGLPVVSTDVGEVSRLLEGKLVGRLVRERSPEAFGAAISEVLKHPPAREACRKQATPYTAGKVLVQVYEAYRELHSSQNLRQTG